MPPPDNTKILLCRPCPHLSLKLLQIFLLVPATRMHNQNLFSVSVSLSVSGCTYSLGIHILSLGIVAQNSFFLCLPCEFRLSRRAREHRGSSCEHRGVCPWEVRTLWVRGLLFDFAHTPRFRLFFRKKKSESKRKPPDPKDLENQRPPGSKTLGQIKDPPVVSGLLKSLGNH